jgi:hypothetical protein
VDSQKLRIAWVAVAASLVIIAIWTGWFGVLWTAIFATFLTVGLKTGSLAPHFPSVTRTQKPVVFGIAMVICAALFVANVLHLLRVL